LLFGSKESGLDIKAIVEINSPAISIIFIIKKIPTILRIMLNKLFGVIFYFFSLEVNMIKLSTTAIKMIPSLVR
jgi:hypothetical protein